MCNFLKSGTFKALFLLFVFGWFTQANALTTKFKVGQTFQKFVQLDGSGSKHMRVPLPEGIWTVAIHKFREHQFSSGTQLAYLFLEQIIEKKLASLLKITYAYENYTDTWRTGKTCLNGTSIALYDAIKQVTTGFPIDCFLLATIRLSAVKKERDESGGYLHLQSLASRGIKAPARSPTFFAMKTDSMGNFIYLSYVFNPAFYGVPRMDDTGPKTHDYLPSRIGYYPKKKAFIDILVKYGEKLNPLIDRGFAGKLTGNENFPLTNLEAISANQNDPKPVAKDLNATQNKTKIERLRKIKSLLEADLITEEEAAAKRKAILDTM